MIYYSVNTLQNELIYTEDLAMAKEVFDNAVASGKYNMVELDKIYEDEFLTEFKSLEIYCK